ncbi:MAG: hypothetical protein VW270_03960 [Candidatus Poseidoniales archaeon]
MSARGQDMMDITADSKLTSMAMGSKDVQDGEGGVSEIQSLLDWNNLVYTMPATNSVVSARNLKTYRSDQLTYEAGDMMEFRLQSGSQYIDFKNSWIRLEMAIWNNAANTSQLSNVTWGSGSAFNLIRDLVVSSRSGTELQRIEDFNVYRSFCDTMKKDHEWFQTVGASIGYTPRVDVQTETTEDLFTDIGFTRNNAQPNKATFAEQKNTVVFDANGGPALPTVLPFVPGDIIRFETTGNLGVGTLKAIELKVVSVNDAASTLQVDQVGGTGNSGADVDIVFTLDNNGVATRIRKKPVGGYIFDQAVGNGGNEVRNVTHQFALPLSMLEGVFAADQLCPSYLASGMRIELRLDSDIKKLFTGVAAGAPEMKYRIIKAEIVLDTFLLNDAAMIELKKVSASNGLEFVYTQIFRQKDTVTKDQVTVEKTITKSVSRALTAWAVRMNNTRDFDTDYFISSGELKYQQWRLGSQYYPHQKIDTKLDNYMNALYAFRTLYKAGSISKKQFEEKYNILVSSFERSNLLRYSGAPINNSRVLSLSAEYVGPANLDATDVFMFLEYVTVAKVFLNNVVVTM